MSKPERYSLIASLASHRRNLPRTLSAAVTCPIVSPSRFARIMRRIRGARHS